MYFVLPKVVYKQSDDNSRRVYALRGSLRDIPTLWNFSGCFIKTKWTQCYSIEQKIIICLTTFLFCFLKQSYSFWGSSSSAHFLSLSPQMYRWSGHDLTSCYTTRNLKLQKWRKLEKIVVLVSQVKLHLSTLLDGCIRNNDYNSVRHKVQSEKFYRSALNLGAVQEKFLDFQWWNNLIGTLMPPTFLH